MQKFQRKLKIVTYITLFSFIFSLFSPFVYPDSVTATAATKEPFAAKRAERLELEDYRTSNSKRYLNPDGTMTEEIYLGNVHYREGKKWKDIDNSLVPSDNSEFKYQNKGNRFKVEFADNTKGNKFSRFSIGDYALEMRPIGLSTKTAQLKDNKITFSQDEAVTGNDIPVSIEYSVGNDSLKEDIVLDEYKKISKFTFQLRLSNVTYKAENDGTIGFYDDKGKKLWFINRPYMVDSAEGYSDSVEMTIREAGKNLFLDIVPNDEWLKDPSRVYPVRIDPTVTEQPEPADGRDTHISQNFPNTNYATSTFLSSGYDSTGGMGVTQSLLWFRLPKLPSGAWITSSTLSLYQYGSYSTTPTVQLYRATSDWSSGTATWNNRPTLAATSETSLTQNVTGWWDFNVSNLVYGWYSYGFSNYGLSLKLSDEGVQRRIFYSSDYAADPTKTPKIVLNYDVNPLGEESFWTYSGDVHIANGNLMLSDTDVSLSGRGVPAVINRTYNSRSNYGSGYFGYGWTSELDMKIMPVAKGPIHYIDSDRTVHYFEQDTDLSYLSPSGLSLELVKNGDGTYTITEKDGLKYQFSSTGTITGISDTNGNSLAYTYTTGKVTITDPSGRKITVNLDANDRISSIVDYAGRQTVYSYNASGDLTQVTAASGTSDAATTKYEYDSSHNMIAITEPRGNKAYYYYTDDDRAQSIIPTNKVENSSFEVNGYSATIPDFWKLTSGQSGTGTTDENSQAPHGYKGFKITASNSNANNYSVYMSEAVPINRSNSYTLSGYVNAAQTAGAQVSVLSLIAYNSSDQNLGEFARTDVNGASGWQRISKTLSANALPVGTAYIKVKTAGSNSSGSGTAWFDGVQFEEGSTFSDFTAPTTYTVNRAAMASAVYDGNGKKTLYKYNENGNALESVIDPSGLNYKTTYTWDNFNNLLTSKDANVNAAGSAVDSVSNQYDAKGNLLSSTEDDGTANKIVDSFTYNSNNDVVTEKSGNANDSNSKAYNSTTQTNNYDNQRNVVSTQDALGTSTASQYQLGNVISETSLMGMADNQLTNSSFERDANTDNWPDNWLSPTINGTASVTWSSNAYIGNKGITISNVSNYVVVGNSEQPTVGTQDYYALSGYFKASTVEAAKAAYLKFDAYNAQGSLIGQVVSKRFGEASKWNKLQLVVWKENLPANTASIRPAVVVDTTSGTVSFDNIQLEKSPFTSEYNMADNSSFERGGALPNNWVNTTSILFDDSTAQKFIGNKSIAITNPSGWAGFAPDHFVPYDSSKGYTLSGFVLASGLSNPANAYLKFNYYDSNQVQLSSVDSNKLTNGTSDWTRLEAHVNPNGAPAGTAYIKPVVTANTFTGTAYFDAIRLQEGNITTAYEYNSADGNGKGGNNYVTKITNPLGNAVSSVYNVATGNIESTTDAKSNTTSYTYDNLDRLKSVSVPGYDLKVKYTYDKNGNKTEVKNSNKADTVTYSTTSFTYDNRDLLTSMTDPLSRVTTLRYDSSGNNTSVEKPNSKTIGYLYDKANRPEKVSYDGSVKYTFGYDANGNRISVQDNSANKTWASEFDKVNRLKKLIAPDGTIQETTYDKNSNRQTLKVTSGSNVYNTSFVHSITDKNIELTDHNNNISQLVYGERDQLVQASSGNGATAYYNYDDAERLTKVLNTKSGGSALSSYSYNYDANDNWTSVTDHTGKSISYTYDSLNQLASETDPASTNTFWYTYDERGNRKTKVVKDVSETVLSTTTYSYDSANQLTSVNGQTYSYDNNGNLLDDGNKLYKWDAEDRLIEVRLKSNNSLIAKYEYDSDGRRVKSEVGGVVTNFHYDGSGIQVLYETDVNGALNTLYTYSDDGVLMSMTKVGQGTYYYHYNGHGDVVQMTDQAGEVKAEYIYDSWGNIISQSGTMASINTYRYSGYRYDEATGLYYLMSRYYDANIGRFITRDTFRGYEDDPQSLNQYVYTKNNPVMYVDPDGHNPIFIGIAVLIVRALAKKYGPRIAAAAYSALKPWLKKVRDDAKNYDIRVSKPKSNGKFQIAILKKGISKPVFRLEFHYEDGKWELHYHVGDSRVSLWKSE
ncbi:DNRLRE domain-containing protein [Paenibacillus sp. LHD-117]|uniref:DNRLRE domain-containing protein n=1 Tax=Paenibacillus sp. LHD-117 TaxID=3071412 RepID=UPI0027DEBF5D|nr:DNRLRE domain-containing protein [Paenibacillus sp. LHD-117]MDQ6418735.1 DNRLRE domain-containing protein [Paenibacillus sp. LHD-117]